MATPQLGELSNCENEPLAWSGRTQDVGALLVANNDGGLTHHSANLAAYFDVAEGTDTVSMHDLFVDDVRYFEFRQQDIFKGSHHLVRNVVTNKGVEGNILITSMGDATCYEFEPTTPPSSVPDRDIKVAQKEMPLADDVDVAELLREIYRLSGFPKIMIYRFLEDSSGEVVAELSDGSLDDYLGLRFPASDIPKIARQLYVDNPYRLIFDVDGETVPIVSRKEDSAQVDLSLSTLRSVSPLHLEYLRNMKVRSSASFSIRIMDKLWGLVALHAVEPTHIDLPSRIQIRQLVTDRLTMPLMDHRVKEEHRRFNANARVLENFAGFLCGKVKEPIGDSALPEGAFGMIDCDGLLVFVDGELVFSQADVTTAEAETLRAVAETMATQTQFATESMVRYFDQDDDLARRASGLIYEGTMVGLKDRHRLEICWLRPEKSVAVDWAGKPEKTEVQEDGTVRISPRQSFDKWTTLSRATSVSWSDTDMLLASRLLFNTLQLANRAM